MFTRQRYVSPARPQRKRDSDLCAFLPLSRVMLRQHPGEEAANVSICPNTSSPSLTLFCLCFVGAGSFFFLCVRVLGVFFIRMRDDLRP